MIMQCSAPLIYLHLVFVLDLSRSFVGSNINCYSWEKINETCHVCMPGYYGLKCTDHCPYDCRVPRSLAKPYCGRLTGKCMHGCHESWWGKTCIHKCNEGCKNGMCYQTDGTCHDGCSDGWYGRRFCEYKCGNCLEDKCSRDGMCRSGCKDGWRSSSCRNKCIPNCLICEQDGRKCVTCTEGYHGENCYSCNNNCKRHTCSNNGTCLAGCNAGFYWNDCSKQCEAGCRECNVKSGKCVTTGNYVTELFTPFTKIPPKVDIRGGQKEKSPEYVTVQMINSDRHTTTRKQVSSGSTHIHCILYNIFLSSSILWI